MFIIAMMNTSGFDLETLPRDLCGHLHRNSWLDLRLKL